jgi:hypothetical protein
MNSDSDGELSNASSANAKISGAEVDKTLPVKFLDTGNKKIPIIREKSYTEGKKDIKRQKSVDEGKDKNKIKITKIVVDKKSRE